MTLCDTGPLVALIDRDDAHHERCAVALKSLPPAPLLTTWPCVTEAMYLLGRAGGPAAQDELWGWVADGLVTIHTQGSAAAARMRELMAEYADAPMDVADASLVEAAEELGLRKIFTVDKHFYAYRIGDGGVFEVVP